ncbi:MAG: type II toxin-antitoxin system MqsA family antitoxin [Nitrospiria bacterium]
MMCVICKNGEPQPGKATVTLEHGETTLVIKGVLVEVCANCGEEYIGDDITEQLLSVAEEAANKGVLVDVRQYVAV